MKLPEEAQGFGIFRYLSLSTINLPTGKMSSLLGKTSGGWGVGAGMCVAWWMVEHSQNNNEGT